MNKKIVSINDCRFEIVENGGDFKGLGCVWIGETLVRSGRLPLTCRTQTFTGLEMSALRLLGVGV